MAASSDMFCDICNTDESTNHAEHWCPECKEAFCSGCLKSHSKMKRTSSHEVLNINDSEQPSLLKIFRDCEEHGKENDAYCSDHQCLCCALCLISLHTKCHGLRVIEKVVAKTQRSIFIQLQPLSNVMKSDQDEKTLKISSVEQGFQKNIHTIKINSKSQLKLPSERTCIELDISGSIIRSNGEIIFSDYENKRLVVIKDNSTVYKDIVNCSDKPRDVTNLDNQVVAITTCDGIQIIDLCEKKRRKIKTEGSCFGIHCEERYLFWCEVGKGIRMTEITSIWLTEMTSKSVSTIVGHEAISNWSYIAAANDNVYVTNCNESSVTCYNKRGDIIWNIVSLCEPRCITTDADLNVYVAVAGTKTINIISPDGKEMRTLINMSETISQVWGLYYDQTRHRLLVSLADGSTFLYGVFRLC